MLGLERIQKLKRARKRNYAISIVEFSLFNDSILGLGIGVGKKVADGRNTRPPVRALHRFFWIEPVLDRPPAPHAGNRRSRVNQNTVQIKEQSTARDFNHD
jgi:hypothetical protein